MGEPYPKRARFWKRTSKPYPNVCDCIGTKVGIFHDRHWWQVRGQAREVFKSVETDILEQLRAAFTDSYTSIVHFHLYMIGRSVESALPTIMFFCEEKEPRKKAKKIVEEGGLLEKLPGFRTGHQAKQPGVGSLIQPATESNEAHQPSLSVSASEVYFDPSRPVRAIGMPIFVKHSNVLVRRATANAVFEGPRCVYMSVAHVFFDSASPKQDTTTDSDSEYDYGSGTEAEDDDDYVNVTSRASMSSSEHSSNDPLDSTSPESDSSIFTNDTASREPVPPVEHVASALRAVHADSPNSKGFGDSREIPPTPPIESLEYLGCMTRSSIDLDWALVEIKNSKVSSVVYETKSNAYKIHGASKRCAHDGSFPINAHTSHGPIPGILSEIPTYMRLPNSVAFQEVYQITLDAPLNWGDCGAVISDALTEKPYGHVIASSSTKRIAYVMEADRVFKASRTQWDSPALVDVMISSSSMENKAIEHSALSGCHKQHQIADQTTPCGHRELSQESIVEEDHPAQSVKIEPLSDRDIDTLQLNDLEGRNRAQPSSPASQRYKSFQPTHEWQRKAHIKGESWTHRKEGLVFITGRTPFEIKSMGNMTTVRKTAMDHYLKVEKETDTRSQSSIQTRDEPTYLQKRLERDTTEQTLITQYPSIGNLPPRPIVRPMRTGIPLPYDQFVPPPLTSIGKSLDPFRTMFESSHPRVSVEDLKFLYSRYFGTYGLEKYWIPRVLEYPHTFLGTLCMASSYHDAILMYSVESLHTAALRQEIVYLVGRDLLHPERNVADCNIIAVAQLIASEVIARQVNSLTWHEAGIETMIKQRGGLGQLDWVLASIVSWLNLESAILHEKKPRTMYRDYCTSDPSERPDTAAIPESPLYCPRGRYTTIQRSRVCKQEALNILDDVRMIIDSFLQEAKSTHNSRVSQTILSLYSKITSDYPSAPELRQTDLLTKYWRYEAIRITSIIQATAIIRRHPLSEGLAAKTQRKPSLLYTSADSESNDSPFPPADLEEEYTNTSIPSYSQSIASSSRSRSLSRSPSRSTSTLPSSRSSSCSSTREFSFPLFGPRPPLVTNTPFSDLVSLPPPCAPTPSDPESLLVSLKDALEKSDLSDCWDGMAGVLLWIGLTAGAASRKSDKVLSKYFAAQAVRVSWFLCFEHPEALHSTLLRMGEIIEGLSNGNGLVAKQEAEGLGKRRRE